MNRQRTLFILATLSGVCGISYELLYARMISSYFGDIYYVTAAVLVVFLLSIGLGALYAHRFLRYLAHIEIAIGAYGILSAYIFLAHMEGLVRAVAFEAAYTPLLLMVSAGALVLLPAFLIGFSVPLFSRYLDVYAADQHALGGFRYAYALYSVGAALAVLLIEFALIQTVGITRAALLIASCNVFIGVLLLSWFRISAEVRGAGRPRLFRERDDLGLFLVSTASGVFQLLFLSLSYRIFGPFNENLAIVLTVVFLGIALGTCIVSKLKPRLLIVLRIGVLMAAGTFAMLTPIIFLWAELQESWGIPHDVSTLLKIAVMSGYGLAAFTSFGMTVPAYLLARYRDAAHDHAGKALALSSFGNAFGFLLVTLVLYRYVDLVFVFLFVVLTIGLAWLVVVGREVGGGGVGGGAAPAPSCRLRSTHQCCTDRSDTKPGDRLP